MDDLGTGDARSTIGLEGMEMPIDVGAQKKMFKDFPGLVVGRRTTPTIWKPLPSGPPLISRPYARKPSAVSWAMIWRQRARYSKGQP
jgi:hypothetical protein